jgi:Anti-sigma factor NepR
MTDKPPSTDAKATGEFLSPRHEAMLETLIGSKLRSYYGELMAEPVPNRILDLLSQLEAKEQEDNAGPDKPAERS